jgi:hypothetical protein
MCTTRAWSRVCACRVRRGGAKSRWPSFRRPRRAFWRCTTGLRRTGSGSSRWRPAAPTGSRSGRSWRMTSMPAPSDSEPTSGQRDLASGRAQRRICRDFMVLRRPRIGSRVVSLPLGLGADSETTSLRVRDPTPGRRASLSLYGGTATRSSVFGSLLITCVLRRMSLSVGTGDDIVRRSGGHPVSELRSCGLPEKEALCARGRSNGWGRWQASPSSC